MAPGAGPDRVLAYIFYNRVEELERRQVAAVSSREAFASRVSAEDLLDNAHLREKPEMKRDVSRLGVACCSPQKFELPQRAPQPALLASTHPCP